MIGKYGKFKDEIEVYRESERERTWRQWHDSGENSQHAITPLQTKAHDVAENEGRRSGGGVHAKAISLARFGSWMQPFELH